MTEEPYLPACNHSQKPEEGGDPGQVTETVQTVDGGELRSHQEEYDDSELEREPDRDSYHERTSGSYTDSYSEGSLAGHSHHRIPYRLLSSPPPQPTHRAPGLPANYRKYHRTILVETSEARPSLVSTVCVQPDKWRSMPGGRSPHW